MLLPLPGGRRGAGARASSRACGWCSTPARRCRRPPGSGCRRWPRRVRGRRRCGSPRPGASTETSPAITSAHWRLERAGVIGLPLPGLELKFVPNGEQARDCASSGVSVFPGYRDAPQLTAQAFDDEGYYCIGDAGVLADDDAARARRGLRRPRRRGLQARHRHLGHRSARCACAWSRRWRRWRRTWWSPATTATRSACWCSPRPQRPRLPPQRAGRAHRAPRCARCRPTAAARRRCPARALVLARAARAPTPARSPTRATSTSARCCAAAPRR